MGKKKNLLILLGALILFPSITSYNPTLVVPPIRVERIDPPRNSEKLWDDMGKCSHLKGDLSRIKWYRTIKEDIPCGKFIVKQCSGVWDRSHSIYLSNRTFEFYQDSPSSKKRYYNFAEIVIEHEMLHDLVWYRLSETGNLKLLDNSYHPAVFDSCGVR